MKPRIVVAAVLIVLLAGCSPEVTPDPEAPASPTTAAESPGPHPGGGKPAVSAVPTDGADLEPGGRYFGYIRTLNTGTQPATFEFDVAEFFTGDAALQEAIDDGDPEAVSMGSLPSDIYIRNRSTNLRAVPVGSDVVVTLISCVEVCGSVTRDLQTLDLFLAGSLESTDPAVAREYYGTPDSLFDITLRDGEAVRIDEQYLP